MKKFRDLEQRTLEFTREVIKLCQKLPKNSINNELVRQCVRSAGSVGANYREANEKLSKKDLAYKIKIARKESKETSYWLELLEESNKDYSEAIQNLFQESIELRNIFSAILNKVS
ncbi:MAG: four helix bundle protein [Patescibacteria group bacterium]